MDDHIDIWNSVCVEEYFNGNGDDNKSDDDQNKKLQGYICVLNSKATEGSMVCKLLSNELKFSVSIFFFLLN